MPVSPVGVSILIGLLAGLTIYSRESGERVLMYFVKPTTTMLILVLAYLSAPEVLTPYAFWIMAGLLFGLFGDVFLMFPDRLFRMGLVSFLIGHVFYIFAFTSGVGFGFTVSILLPVGVFGGIVFLLLRPHLKTMLWPVVVYILVICLMATQAWSRWSEIGGSLQAALGAALFLISDAILALNRFRKPFRRARAMNLSTYFLAQWLIALSVGG